MCKSDCGSYAQFIVGHSEYADVALRVVFNAAHDVVEALILQVVVVKVAVYDGFLFV